MASIPVKPKNPVIDWKNPLTRGMVFHAPLFENSSLYTSEFISKVSGTFNGTPKPAWIRKSLGVCVDFSGTTPSGDAIYFTPNEKARGVTKLSLEFIFIMEGPGANNQATLYRETNNSSSSISVRNWDASASSIVFSVTFSVTSPVWRITGLSTNTLYHLVITYDGSSSSNVPDFWVNGSKRSVTTTTAASGTMVVTADSQFILGNINQTGNVGTRTWDGQIIKATKYNYVLIPSSINALYKNPWCIYKKPPTIYGNIVSAATAIKDFISFGMIPFAR